MSLAPKWLDSVESLAYTSCCLFEPFRARGLDVWETESPDTWSRNSRTIKCAGAGIARDNDAAGHSIQDRADCSVCSGNAGRVLGSTLSDEVGPRAVQAV